MAQKVVIIGHGYTSRLGIIRSLGVMGYDVIVIAMVTHGWWGRLIRFNGGKPIDCYSKYVHQMFYCRTKDGEDLIQLLLNHCVDARQKVIIIPDSDFSAAVIDKNQERLREHFLFPHIHHKPGAVVDWMDKVKQKELAKQVGMNVAKACVVEIRNRQYEIPSAVSYPCFTKPLATIAGGKDFLRRCNNETELRTVLELAGNLGDVSVLVEEYKEIGTEYAVLGFSSGEDVIIPGVVQILMMAHGGHYGVACQGKVMPVEGFEQLISQFRQFVLQIGYVGLFDIDFYESGGTLYFGELNLRFGGSGYAITKMGVNLPAMLVKHLRGEDYSEIPDMIKGTSTYVNERMCIDDWISHYITEHEYNSIINGAGIKFVYDADDLFPYFRMKHFFRLQRIKRVLKKWLKR